MVPKFGSNVGNGLDGTGMQIVLQTSFLRQPSTAMWASVDLGNQRCPLLCLRRAFPIKEIKLRKLKWGQSLDPGPGMAADREKDEFPDAFHGIQIRECGLLDMEQRRDACQEFDVVRPFDDDQDTHRWGMLDNPPR